MTATILRNTQTKIKILEETLRARPDWEMEFCLIEYTENENTRWIPFLYDPLMETILPYKAGQYPIYTSEHPCAIGENTTLSDVALLLRNENITPVTLESLLPSTLNEPTRNAILVVWNAHAFTEFGDAIEVSRYNDPITFGEWKDRQFVQKWYGTAEDVEEML
jgi:hypothetical protein